jgi:hypothetical protein
VKFAPTPFAVTQIPKENSGLPSGNAVAFLASAPERQAIIAKMETGMMFRGAGLFRERGIKITVGIDFVGGALPGTFNERAKLRTSRR